MNRRNFLKKSGMAGFAAILFPINLLKAEEKEKRIISKNTRKEILKELEKEIEKKLQKFIFEPIAPEVRNNIRLTIENTLQKFSIKEYEITLIDNGIIIKMESNGNWNN